MLSQRFPELDPTAIHAYLVLQQVGSELASARDAHLARHDLGQGRFMAMILLYTATDPLSPAELAEMTGVTRATMSGLLDTLQQADLIRREPHARDRRGVLVHLTDQGRSRLEAMLPDHYRRLSALMQGLTQEERVVLTRLLTKVREAMPVLRNP